MANIVTVAVPAFIEESSEYDTQYKRTMKWDPEKGDFVRNAANQVAECTGEAVSYTHPTLPTILRV